MKKKKPTKKAIYEFQEPLEKAETEAKAELAYWATGRTKIYPEADFAKNYAKIKAKSEKKRDRKTASARFGSDPQN